MKRVKLVKAITQLGCVLERHGGKHDWYRNPATGVCQPVPRHREINDGLARHIIKMLENPQPEGPGAESSEEQDA